MELSKRTPYSAADLTERYNKVKVSSDSVQRSSLVLVQLYKVGGSLGQTSV